MPKRKLSELTENCYIVCDSNEQLRVIVGMLKKEGYAVIGELLDAERVISIDPVYNHIIAASLMFPVYPASDFLPDGEEKPITPDLTNITTVMAEYIRAGKSFSYDAGTGTLMLTNTEQ